MNKSEDEDNDNNKYENEEEKSQEDEDEEDTRDILQAYKNKNIYNKEDEEGTVYKKPDQRKVIDKYFKPLIKEENKSSNIRVEKPKIDDNPLNEILNEKLNELNKEIDKFKKENEKVGKLKSEYDRLTKKINREIEDFNKRKEIETNEFEQYKAEEIKKIEKERKAHIKNSKQLQNMPNRKEREEIESLKEQVVKLQEEMKSKDQRNKLALDRVRKQLEESTKRNEELQKELRMMEELRVKNMSTTRDKSKPKTQNVNPIKPAATSNMMPINKNPPKKSKTDLNLSDDDYKPILNTGSAKNIILIDSRSKDISEYNNEDNSSDEEIVLKKNTNINKTSFQSQPVEVKKDVKMTKPPIPENKSNKPQIQPIEVKKKPEQNKKEEEEVYEMVFPEKYHGKAAKNSRLITQEILEDGKIIKLFENMKREITFPSNAVKEIFEDGYQITYLTNNDIKQVYPDKREIYLFHKENTLQFKFPDGVQVYKFATNQLEKHFPDGTKQVIYPDGILRYVYSDGQEEIFFPDGTLQRKTLDGEICNEYPDGIKVKIINSGYDLPRRGSIERISRRSS
jgi:centromere protein J